jgi:hypothetical protein
MTALSKEQAAAISDDLFAHETRRNNNLRNFVSGFVHPFYRFSELSGLQPWEQRRLIQAAGAIADKRLPVLLSGLLFVAAIVYVSFFAPHQYQGSSGFFAVFVFLGIPFAFIRRAFVRGYVLVLLAQESTAK